MKKEYFSLKQIISRSIGVSIIISLTNLRHFVGVKKFLIQVIWMMVLIIVGLMGSIGVYNHHNHLVIPSPLLFFGTPTNGVLVDLSIR